MLLLVFQIGADRYAIEATHVLEVLPLVTLKQLPGAPSGIAGVLNYHGVPVPIVDLSQLAIGVPSRYLMSTRIILVTWRNQSGQQPALGLIAEHATETLRCAEGDFVDPGVSATRSAYLGPVAMGATGIIQRVELEAILPDNIRHALVRQNHMEHR